jgi:hypothetical protein
MLRLMRAHKGNRCCAGIGSVLCVIGLQRPYDSIFSMPARGIIKSLWDYIVRILAVEVSERRGLKSALHALVDAQQP